VLLDNVPRVVAGDDLDETAAILGDLAIMRGEERDDAR